MRIQRVVEAVVDGVSGTPPATAANPPAAPTPTGAGSQSTFETTTASAPTPAPTTAPSSAPTVTVAAVTAGAALTVPAPSEGFQLPSPVTLEALLEGGDEGQPPITRAQVIATLTQVVPGARDVIAKGVTDASLAAAFGEVIESLASPGTKTVEIELTELVSERVESEDEGRPQRVVTEAPVPTRVSADVEVGADRTVNGQPLAIEALVARDVARFPHGDSADGVLTRCEPGAPGQPEVCRQEKVDTILAAIPESQRGEARALISRGVTADSLQAAFEQVLEARKTPGSKNLSVSLVGEHYVETSTFWRGMETRERNLVNEGASTFGGPIEVDDAGRVNGSRLPADMATEMITRLRKVPTEFKEQTLRAVGLDDNWFNYAGDAIRDYALARILEAASTPGGKDVDLTIQLETPDPIYSETGDGLTTYVERLPGAVHIEVSADGKINGTTPVAALAYRASRTVEAMSEGTRRSTLKALGFEDEVARSASVGQVEYVLVKASVATATPGEQQFEVGMGDKKYAVGMQIGEGGQILGAATQEIPPPPKGSWWSGPVTLALGVVSALYPPAALVCGAIRGAIAISQGATGLRLLGAVAGAAAGLSDIANLGTITSTLSSAANVLNGVAGAVTAAKAGDGLGALAGVLEAGTNLGGEAGKAFLTPAAIASGVNTGVTAARRGDLLGVAGAVIGVADDSHVEMSDTLRAVGWGASELSGVTQAINNRDSLAFVSYGAAFGNTVNVLNGDDTSPTLSTIEKIADTAIAIRDKDYEAATKGLMGLAGIEPYYGPGVSVSRPEGPHQSDVRRIDNAIDAGGADGSNDLGGGDDDHRVEGGAEASSSTSGPYALGNARLGDVSAGPRLGGGDPSSTASTAHTVARGDTLSAIAAQTLGDANRWPEIYAYNFERIGKDPNALKAGVELEIPPANFQLPANLRNQLFDAAYIPPKIVQAPTLDPLALAGTIPFDTGAFLGSAGDGSSFGLPSATARRVNNLTVNGDGAEPPGPERGVLETALNGAVNAARMTGHILYDAAKVTSELLTISNPMSEANATFRYIFREELGPWLNEKFGSAESASETASKIGAAFERAVGRMVFTVMDPREWGPALGTAWEMVTGGTVRLAQTLAQDPSSVTPEMLVQRGNDAIQGLALVAGLKGAAQLAADGLLAANGVQMTVRGLTANAGAVVDAQVGYALSSAQEAGEAAGHAMGRAQNLNPVAPLPEGVIPTYGNQGMSYRFVQPVLNTSGAVETGAQIDAMIARSSGLDETMYRELERARRSVNELGVVEGGGGSAGMSYGRTAVDVGVDNLTYVRLEDGLEVIGMNPRATSILSHEIDGHIARGTVANVLPDGPYVLALVDSGAPSVYSAYARIDELYAYNTGATSARDLYLAAMRSGDLEAARLALYDVESNLATSRQLASHFEPIYTQAATAAENPGLIRQTIRDVVDGVDAQGLPIVNNRPTVGSRFVEFEVELANGARQTVRTTVPVELTNTDDLVALVTRQLEQAPAHIAQQQELTAMLSRELEAFNAHARAHGVPEFVADPALTSGTGGAARMTSQLDRPASVAPQARPAATPVQVEMVDDMMQGLDEMLVAANRTNGVNAAVRATLLDQAGVFSTRVNELGAGTVMSDLASVVESLGPKATPDQVRRAISAALDPAYREPGQLSALTKQAMPSLATKLQSAPVELVDRIAPQLDRLISSLGEVPATVRRALSEAGPTRIENTIANAQALVDAGRVDLLNSLIQSRNLADVAPAALVRYLEVGEVSAAPTPQWIAALRNGPDAVDQLAGGWAAARASATAAASSVQEVRTALGLPDAFPVQQWNLEALAAFREAPLAVRQQLASGRGAVWDEIREAGAMRDPAAARALVDRLNGPAPAPLQQAYARAPSASFGPTAPIPRVRNVPTFEPGEVLPRSTYTPLSTGATPAERVADVERVVQNWKAAGSRIDLELHEAMTNARGAVDSMEIRRRLGQGTAEVGFNRGSSHLSVSPHDISYQQAGGLEFIGMERTAAGPLNHEVRGHVNDILNQAAQPSAPSMLRYSVNVPGYANGVHFSEIPAWVESSLGLRTAFVDAVATGDRLAAQQALRLYQEGLRTLRAAVTQVQDATQRALANTASLVRDTIAPVTDSRGRLIPGHTPDTFVARFDVVDNGRRVSMSAELPVALSSRPGEAARLVQLQLQAAREQLPTFVDTYNALLRDQKAMTEYLGRTPNRTLRREIRG